MIGTVTVRVNAGHPNVPVSPISVYAGSALAIGVIDVPKTRCGVTVTGVSITIKNADATSTAVNASLVGGVWCATFPASHFASVGISKRGLVITATNGTASYCIGVGDVTIMDPTGAVTPGETVHAVTDKTYQGQTVNIETEDGMANAVKKLLTTLGATVVGCLMLAVHASPPPGYTNNTYTSDGVTYTRHGALNTRAGYVVTDISGGSDVPTNTVLLSGASLVTKDGTHTVTAANVGAATAADITAATNAMEAAGTDTQIVRGSANALYGWNISVATAYYASHDDEDHTITATYATKEEAQAWAAAVTNVEDIVRGGKDELFGYWNINVMHSAQAEFDSNNNHITTTYATKNEVSAIPTTYAMTNRIVSLNCSAQYIVADGNPITIAVPTAVTGGVRDWIVYANATADTALNLTNLGGILCADAAYTNALAANKVTALYITEMTNNVYVIGRQELTPVK